MVGVAVWVGVMALGGGVLAADLARGRDGGGHTNAATAVYAAGIGLIAGATAEAVALLAAHDAAGAVALVFLPAPAAAVWWASAWLGTRLGMPPARLARLLRGRR